MSTNDQSQSQSQSEPQVSCKKNFYMYMNKKWLDDPANAIPAEYSTWGGFTKLDDEGILKQIQMVKDLKNQEFKNEEETKISAIWEASNARFTAWANDTATCDPISRELEILDAVLPLQSITDTRLADYFYYTDQRDRECL